MINKNQYKIIKQDDVSVSCYFNFKGMKLYADLSNVYNLFNEFEIFKCNKRGVVDYSSGVFVMQTDSVTEKELVSGIERFKKRFVN